MPTSFTDLPRESDVVKSIDNPVFSYDSVFIKNTSGQACDVGEIFAGCLLRNNSGVWETLLNANVTDLAGIVVDTRPVEAVANGGTTTKRYKILTKGPAIVNHDQIPTADLAGTPYTAASVTAALEALFIRYFEESPSIETQDT